MPLLPAALRELSSPAPTPPFLLSAPPARRRLHGTKFRISDYPKLAHAFVEIEGDPVLQPAASAEQPLLDAEHGDGAGGGAGGIGDGGEGASLGWSALWEPRYRRVMVLAAAIPLAQQASGINTVVFYSSQVGPRKQGWRGGSLVVRAARRMCMCTPFSATSASRHMAGRRPACLAAGV